MDLTNTERQAMLYELSVTTNKELGDIQITGKLNDGDTNQAIMKMQEYNNKQIDEGKRPNADFINQYNDENFAKTDKFIEQAFAASYNKSHPNEHPISADDPASLKGAVEKVKAEYTANNEKANGSVAELTAANHYLTEHPDTSFSWNSFKGNNFKDRSADIAKGALTRDEQKEMIANFKEAWNNNHGDNQQLDTDKGLDNQTRLALKQVNAASGDAALIATENHALERSGASGYIDKEASKMSTDEKLKVREAFQNQFKEGIEAAGGEKNAVAAIDKFVANNKGTEQKMSHEDWSAGVAAEAGVEVAARKEADKNATLADNKKMEKKPATTVAKKDAPHKDGAAHDTQLASFVKKVEENGKLKDGSDLKQDKGLAGKEVVEALTVAGFDTSALQADLNKKGGHGIVDEAVMKDFIAKNKGQEAIMAKVDDTPDTKKPVLADDKKPVKGDPALSDAKLSTGDPGIGGGNGDLQKNLDLDKAIMAAGLGDFIKNKDDFGKFITAVKDEQLAASSGSVDDIKKALQEHAQLPKELLSMEETIKHAVETAAKTANAKPLGGNSVEI